MAQKPNDIHISTEVLVKKFQWFDEMKPTFTSLLTKEKQVELARAYSIALNHIEINLINPFKDQPEFSAREFEQQAQSTIDKGQRIIDPTRPVKDSDREVIATAHNQAVAFASMMATTIYNAVKEKADESLIGCNRWEYPVRKALIPTVNPMDSVRVRKPAKNPKSNKPGT